MLRSSVLFPEPLAPMMTKIVAVPHREVQTSCMITKSP